MITFQEFNAISLFTNLPMEIYNFVKKFPISTRRIRVVNSKLGSKSWTTIFKEGEECHFFYFLLEGEAITSKMSYDGNNIIENVLSVGDFFGGGCLEKKVHGYTAMGKKDTTLLMIEKRDFWEMINSKKELQERLFVLQEKKHEKQMELVKIITGTDSGIVKVGLTLAFLQKHNEGMPICLIHQDLADITRMARETVTRALDVLKEFGYVRTSIKKIEVLKKIEEYDLLNIAEKIKQRSAKIKKQILKKGAENRPCFFNYMYYHNVFLLLKS